MQFTTMAAVTEFVHSPRVSLVGAGLAPIPPLTDFYGRHSNAIVQLPRGPRSQSLTVLVSPALISSASVWNICEA
jgi:hypothetical protein